MRTKQTASEYKLLSGLFFRLLPYQVLLIVISAVNGIVDSLFASNAIKEGVTAMSAIGLFGPINHFLYALSMMLVSGTQMLYGRYLAKDREKIHGLFSANLLSSLGVSLLTAGLLALGVVTGATRVLVQDPAVLTMLNGYILGQAVGIPALVVGQQLFAFLSLENQKTRTMAASLVCFVFNGIMDYVLLVPVPWGTFGLGLSSSLSMWVFLAVQAVFYLRGKSEWKPSPRRARWRDVPQIAKLGYPGALSRFVEMFRCLIVNALILKAVGPDGLSAFAASNSVLAVFWALPFGMMAVSRMLFSISVGEEDRRSLRDAMHVVLTRGMPIMCGVAALLALLADPLTRLFYHDPAAPVYAMTVNGFRLLPLCMPLAVLSLNFACFAQTAEKKVLSVVLPVVDGMLGVVLCSLFLIPAMQMDGLYLANILNGVICLLVILAGSWLARKRPPRSLEDLMAIPARIGVSPEERIDISVRDMVQVTEVSGRVIAFCKERGIDGRRAFWAGLCLEEMAGNVIAHGFTADSAAHSVDIRVTHKDQDIILRIRDNCLAFNPTEYARLMEPGEAGKNAGIRLVFRAARDVRYQNLLGMNVLTIRI